MRIRVLEPRPGMKKKRAGVQAAVAATATSPDLCFRRVGRRLRWAHISEFVGHPDIIDIIRRPADIVSITDRNSEEDITRDVLQQCVRELDRKSGPEVFTPEFLRELIRLKPQSPVLTAVYLEQTVRHFQSRASENLRLVASDPRALAERFHTDWIKSLGRTARALSFASGKASVRRARRSSKATSGDSDAGS